MTRILLIEDEDIIRRSLRRLLERADYSVCDAASIEQAAKEHTLGDFELILSDLRLPGAAGTRIMQLAPTVPVIIMTSYASVRSAVDAIKQGAVDYIAKPFDHDELLLTIERVLDECRLKRRSAALKADIDRDYPVDGMIGQCTQMQQIFDWVRKVAPTDASVLVLGESGTGKELVARAVHERSKRRGGPLIAVNCAAIPDTLIEAELFGHEKGAFTGAVGSRQGLVEAADGGTLFLDEIGELPLAAQARLLRVLQECEIRRVGASGSRKVDIRLVAATHRNLAQMVEAQQFREDLYFRIHVMEIRLPPLREREQDVINLANFFLGRACQRLHRPPMRFHPDAIDALRCYSWPGNVRELGNVLERAVILSESDLITPELLALPKSTPARAEPEAASAPDAGRMDLSLEDYFREFVLSNQDRMTETELAKRLGISRKALWEKRHRLGIPRRSDSA